MDPTRSETARDESRHGGVDRLVTVAPRLVGAAFAVAATVPATAATLASQPPDRSVAIGDAAGIGLPDPTAAGPLDPGATAVAVGGAVVLAAVLVALARLGTRRRAPELPGPRSSVAAQAVTDGGQAAAPASAGTTPVDDPERLLAEAMGRHHASRRNRVDPAQLPVWVRRLDPESRGLDPHVEEPVEEPVDIR